MGLPGQSAPPTCSWAGSDAAAAGGGRRRAMIKAITSSIRTAKIASLFLALLLTAGIFTEGTAAAASPQDTVRSFYETLLATMKDGRALGQSGRDARLAPVVNRTFDLPFMARLAVGPSWAMLTSAQQQQVTGAFAHYVSATYADRFDSYSGEQLQVIGERPYGSDVIVQTKIVDSKGEPTALNYLMRE